MNLLTKYTSTLSSNDTEKQQRIMAYILCIICLLSLFLFLGDTFFNTRGEPREAIVAYSMLEYNNWILPINNGDEIAFKPPLLHWMIATVSSITGAVTEFTSRFPSALALSLMTLAGYFFYARRRGTEVAMIAALLTLSNFEVHRAGVACRVDMLLSALMVGALYAMYRWTERGEKGLPWIAWLCLSGAALTKGPVGVLLPCMVVGLYMLLRKRSFWYAFWRLALLAIAALVPLFIWYYLAYHQPHGGQRFLDLIYEENVLRLLGKMTYASHINPWWYNVQTVVSGFVPYTLLFLFALPLAWRKMRSTAIGAKLKQCLTKSAWCEAFDRLRGMDDVRLFTLLSIVVMFLFYCIPASKRSTYLLPIYPFLAYFIAEFVLWLRDTHPRPLLWFGRFVAALCILLTLLFFAIRLGGIRPEWFAGMSHGEISAFVSAIAGQHMTLLQMIAVALPVGMVVYYLMKSLPSERRKTPHYFPLSLCLMVLSLFLALDGYYQPTILNIKSDYDVAQDIKGFCPVGQIYSYRAEYVEANRMHPFTINFYLDDRVIPIDKAKEEPHQGVLIVSGDDIEKFKAEFPQYTIEAAGEPIYVSRHRSSDDRRLVKVYLFFKKQAEDATTASRPVTSSETDVVK